MSFSMFWAVVAEGKPDFAALQARKIYSRRLRGLCPFNNYASTSPRDGLIKEQNYEKFPLR